jgi:uncharacterized protein
MTEEVVDAAIDFWLASAGEEPRLNLSFYGGEPWLEAELMRRALTRARSRVGAQQSVQCMAPTNGLLVDRAALDGGFELAVSIDAARNAFERRYADGRDPTPALPALLPHAPLARMTVTPSNVAQLCQNVQAVARLGFRNIVFQPAWELDWDSSAIRLWSREHACLATWMRGARQAGARLPELPNLTGVLARLRRGAGVSLSAVATDGALFPCYRFVFGADYRLGDVVAGITAHEAWRELAALRPDELSPEDGTCTSCAARGGCTHFCPALGHQRCGDLRAVPAVVCALSRAAVLATCSAFC